MAFFKEKTEEERAADAARKAAAAAKRAEQAFWASPQGLATTAFKRGDEFFQVEIPHSSVTGFTNAAFNSATAGKIRRQLTRTDLLGQIEEAGWRLEHADWVYIQTGQNSRDKFLASGQHVVVTGEVVGIYLFRRNESQSKASTPPPKKALMTPNPTKALSAPKTASQRAVPADANGASTFVVGEKLRVRAAGDEYDGKVGTFHEYVDDQGDGLTIGVFFAGETHICAFSPNEVVREP
ncbi:hypothetical protein [Mycolicibacterium celeriflavum]|uniref:Uncharacterized protein n=1 Tax=Mycolicibacterium celeriflavum TaxID=1249101 RepID=A0A1X0BVF3_MYCCF|nr:hypothetical protein [Mycolicibacterium celeriflavum]MCV7240572.1 hypothetical protein [Mycolicibacterium celeriflavum]ORA48055.1 hypothetical protein BST21_10560 [Mycolicibacterium celeriflavum]BBY43418.1 hypothetical protein MCEL_17130 [Mycolicibacterium celeriflavum]